MNLKRVLSGALAFAIMTSVLSGCGNKEGSTDKPSGKAGETAESTVSGTVRILSKVTGGKDEAEMKLFAEELSKATGLKIEIEMPPSDYNNVLMQKLQGGDKYDLVYVDNNYGTLVEQGALMDITDKVKDSKILSNNIDPQEWKDIQIIDKIFAGFNKKEIHRLVSLNNAQLKKAGIDYKSIEPTLDGYYSVFKKLREAYPDKDYYPLNAVLSETNDIQPWMASVGLKDGVVIDTDGTKYCPYATEAAAPVYEWLKKLYDEKLLDPASFVDKTKDMRNKMGASSQKTGVCVDWAIWVGLHNANALSESITSDQFEVVSLPGAKTPDGNYLLYKGAASLFGIPVNAENPDGAIKVLEYFATQEGGNLLSVGIEGTDYTKEGDKYTLTDLGKKHACDHGAPCPIFKDFVHPIGYNPGVDEALSYGKYAKIDLTISDEKGYKTTVGKWIIQMVKGDVSISDGITGMHDELLSLGYIGK